MKESNSLSCITTVDSPIHGTGVVAVRSIKAGQWLGRYEGERIPDSEAEQRDSTKLFDLGNGYCIDGAVGGNWTQFVNHSCEPNCEAYIVGDGVEFYTLQRIYPGDELFIDYQLMNDDDTDPADYPCNCGSASCRGTLLAVNDGT